MKNKKTNFDMQIDSRFLMKKTPILKLKKAAEKVVNELHEEHFNPRKKMGWDVLFGYYVTDVFYTAFGHNLENYLLSALAEKDSYNLKVSDKHDGLVISKRPKTKRKKK